MMELKHQRRMEQKPRRPLAKIAAFAGTLLLAGAMGCAAMNRPPPKNTKTRCWSFGVPPRDPAAEINPPDNMEKYERLQPGPMGTYIRCITVEQPPMPGD